MGNHDYSVINETRKQMHAEARDLRARSLGPQGRAATLEEYEGPLERLVATTAEPADLTMHLTRRTGLLKFVNDVRLTFVPAGPGCLIHAESASRVGIADDLAALFTGTRVYYGDTIFNHVRFKDAGNAGAEEEEAAEEEGAEEEGAEEEGAEVEGAEEEGAEEEEAGEEAAAAGGDGGDGGCDTGAGIFFL